MSNRTYDTLKIIALIIAPVTVFVAAVMSAWNIPYAEPVTATLAAIDTLLGAIVEIMRRAYNRELDQLEETIKAEEAEE